MKKFFVLGLVMMCICSSTMKAQFVDPTQAANMIIKHARDIKELQEVINQVNTVSKQLETAKKMADKVGQVAKVIDDAGRTLRMADEFRSIASSSIDAMNNFIRNKQYYSPYEINSITHRYKYNVERAKKIGKYFYELARKKGDDVSLSTKERMDLLLACESQLSILSSDIKNVNEYVRIESKARKVRQEYAKKVGAKVPQTGADMAMRTLMGGIYVQPIKSSY